MSETQAILGKITALRQRLDQARQQAREAGATAGEALEEDELPGPARLWGLEKKAAEGARQGKQIEAAVRLLVGGLDREPSTVLPTRLTARARRVLERGRELLHALRELSHEPLVQEAGHPFALLYRETTAMTDAALRLAQELPDSPGGQLQLCEGIEAVLNAAVIRLGSLNHGLRLHREETRRVSLLVEFLQKITAGGTVDLVPLTVLAETILHEVGEGMPLRFLAPPTPEPTAEWVAEMVARHGLTVAQVVARLVRHDVDLRSHALEAVVAALLHDVGMLQVPSHWLASPELLDDDGKRALEAHCRAGAEMLDRAFPGMSWLSEAAMAHHERCDGTGYPGGLREHQVSSMARLIAVCDMYAALCQPRPHRAARETRTALTDTLLLAEQNFLDRQHAERLLQLSFYPVGSVVETAEGALAVVVAAPAGRDLNAPARPVVALLTNSRGHFLAVPHHVDLARSERHSIIRALPATERRQRLALRYPEWAW